MTRDMANPRLLQDHIVPRDAELAGYAALIAMLGVEAPIRALSAVANASVTGGRKTQDGWTIFDKRFMPANSLAGQLAFAMRHEQIDLLILKRLFQKVSPQDIASIFEAEPTGATARRIWFFYEWLTKVRVPVPDLDQGNYVEALTPEIISLRTPLILRGTGCVTIFSELRRSVRCYAGAASSRIRSTIAGAMRRRNLSAGSTGGSSPERPASFCWLTARLPTRSKASGRHVTVWNFGCAWWHRPVADPCR